MKSALQQAHEEYEAMVEVVKRAREVTGWSLNPKSAVAMLAQAIGDLDDVRAAQRPETALK